MDPVSLTLAILPLALGAIKGYHELHKRLKTFCHYSREIKRQRKHLDRQRQLFHNELHLLIKIALKDDLIVESMMENSRHAKWSCKDLEKSLQSFLGKSYKTCFDTIKDISITVEDLEVEMSCFNKFNSHRRSSESMKDTVRRLRSSLKITWNRSVFEKSETDLRRYNDDLRHLRLQASDIKDSKLPVREIQRQLSSEYGSYGSIRKASKALHDTFASSWSTAVTHNVLLFIDAKVEEQVCMDIAVRCFGHMSNDLGLFRPNPRRFQIRSKSLEWIECKTQSPPPSDSEYGHKKRQKVLLGDDCASSKQREIPVQLPTPEGPEPQSAMCENLSGADICSTLAGERSNLIATTLPQYLGYMETSSTDSFRHSIYQSTENNEMELQKLAPMSRMFERSVDSAMTVVDQLKLARNMVAAVLKFHSTPWLNQYFEIDDFNFYKIDAELSSSLQTLHFSIDIASKSRTGSHDTRMQGTFTSDTPQDLVEAFKEARTKYGIRNVTLWSLAQILIQIGRWSSDIPRKFTAIRDLSDRVPPLGPRYQQLTQQCMDCDFGYGDDLSKPRLQQAIYENLVVGLTEMIENLSIR